MSFDEVILWIRIVGIKEVNYYIHLPITESDEILSFIQGFSIYFFHFRQIHNIFLKMPPVSLSTLHNELLNLQKLSYQAFQACINQASVFLLSKLRYLIYCLEVTFLIIFLFFEIFLYAILYVRALSICSVCPVKLV